MVLGVLSGAMIGLGFDRENWLGGYSSWTRRMLRLGHIAFFGMAFFNLTYALTVQLQPGVESSWSSYGILVASLGMPTVCFLSAFVRWTRYLFPIPVLGAGIALVLVTAKLFPQLP